MTHQSFRGALLALLSVAALEATAAPCPITTIAPAASLPDAAVGSAYAQSFTASNGAGLPFAFALTGGLPAATGLTLSPQGPGSAQLAGTPTEVGTYVFTLSATDSSGCSGGRIYALDVVPGSQTISFTSPPPADAAVGDTYAVAATATSGLPVVFSIAPAAASVCSLAGSLVTFDAAGTCTIEANQAGDANWNPAPQAQQSFMVGRGTQTITFTSTAPADAVVAGAAYEVAATASSGLPVTFSIDAAAAAVCSISGSTVSFQGAGSCVVNADQAGDADWNPAQAQQSFAVGRGAQTISFTSSPPADAAVGDTYAVAATATSGLPVAFSIAPAAASVCSLAGSIVTFDAAGTCVIEANQAGDANWNPAPQAQQSFTVGRGTQAITFTSTAPTDAVVAGAAYEVAATASSGLPVTFSIDAAAAAVCSISGSTVSFQGAGSCVVNADQAGNADWNPAPQAQQSFVVGRGTQAITFTSTAPADAVVAGAAYEVAATASSGLPVTFSIDAAAAAVCSISGSMVSFQGAGSCVVNADQAGDADWNPAPQAQQSFAVGRGAQTISFTSSPPADAAVGDTYAVAATATSGLPVAFSITPAAASVCSLAGSLVTFDAAGTCVIEANQAGDADWNAAPAVQQSVPVERVEQTITFTSTPPGSAAVGGPGYAVSATASSGLAVTLSIDPSASGVCTLAGATVSFQAVGTCVVNADQAGDATYAPAPRVQQSVAVGPGSQTITFTSTAPPGAVVAGAAYAATATASSGLPVTLSIAPAAASVCAISGGTVSFHGAGTCIVAANQPGDANWNPAPQAQQSFMVGRGTQTITFTSPAPSGAVVAGALYAATATANSGLPVTLSIDPAAASVCAIGGGAVSFHGAGTCIVNANQAGDADWNPAPQAQQSFAVGRGTQTITFTSAAPADAVVAGTTYEVAATASSGLPVTFSIDAAAAAVCSISGSTVSFQGAGTCVVNANQAGDADWNPAQAQQSFAVGRGAQTISFTSTPPSSAFVNGPTYAVAATSSSGLAVTFSIDASASAVCTVSGATVSFVGSGTCVVNANQAGDANWTPAPQVQQSFAVASCVVLELGEVRHLSPGALPCVLNTSGSAADYTLLPANFSDIGDSTLSLTATGIQPVSGPPLPRPAAQTFGLAPLRDAEAGHAHGPADPAALPLGRPHRPSDLIEAPRGSVTPLVPGQLIDINAAVGGCSGAPDIRKGRVEVVTTAQWAGQPLLFAVQEVVETTPGAGDWHPPVPGGYAALDLTVITDAFVMEPPGNTSNASGTLGSLARSGAMGLARDNLGLITDIDGNGGVILFFTPKMNELSPPATSGITSGMFQPRDMFSAASCPNSNEGEILYLMVPDPTGVVNSNVRTLSFTFGNAMPTLVHHFTHMTSAWRRSYLHGATPLEEMWLDEAIAWQMQELVFFNTSAGLGPRMNIQLSDLTTGPNASRRVAAFNTYQNPMYGHDRVWLYQLSGTNGNRRVGPLLRHPTSNGTIPTVHEYAAQNFSPSYTFLRYMLDRRNGDDAALLSSLVNTSASGLANLQAVFGVAPRDWARDFLIALYADDAVAAAAPEHRLPSWNYRSVYSGLGGYPLAVDTLNDGVPLTFSLRPGGGARYTRFGVAAGQAAGLSLTEGGSTPNANVMTSILRTK